jgi:hypothetical protein
MEYLKRVENITDEDLAELWPVIGGTPHFFDHGKDELRTGLVDGDWSESGLQMDYYTMVCMLKRLKELGYDTDCLIDQGLAKEK